ncbi:hypothetical protein BV898_20334, partial [Hypsibius exemplaris]
NRELATISDIILRTIGQNTTERISINFQHNGNQCDGCGLNSLYTWVRDTPATT